MINTESSGLTQEVVPAANHFILEINHFNKIISTDIAPKLSNEDAFWNAKTLESIQQSVKEDGWVNLWIKQLFLILMAHWLTLKLPFTNAFKG